MSTIDELYIELEVMCSVRDNAHEEIRKLLKQIKGLTPSPRNMNKVVFPIVRDYNCMVGAPESDKDTVFGVGQVISMFDKADIFDILVASGAFESKGQARKNWTGIKELSTGYSEVGPIGKSKLMLFIWNPSK